MKLTYEQAVNRLETIVEELEDGSLPIEDSLKLYEEGAARLNFVIKFLKKPAKK